MAETDANLSCCLKLVEEDEENDRKFEHIACGTGQCLWLTNSRDQLSSTRFGSFQFYHELC